ncbi:hypothetical protein B0I35DRAFT_271060 [Stachybotrys elegans]|uniref:Uncharacterized protein n=1 Tax=Stachybotrys elegans TaxID=80388 RepID=A0A8K0WQQ5_9HYPO|nr:hypothetical protein B0I35DRAFT_271060 [Stachybotrys elegans]
MAAPPKRAPIKAAAVTAGARSSGSLVWAASPKRLLTEEKRPLTSSRASLASAATAPVAVARTLLRLERASSRPAVTREMYSSRLLIESMWSSMSSTRLDQAPGMPSTKSDTSLKALSKPVSMASIAELARVMMPPAMVLAPLPISLTRVSAPSMPSWTRLLTFSKPSSTRLLTFSKPSWTRLLIFSKPSSTSPMASSMESPRVWAF